MLAYVKSLNPQTIETSFPDRTPPVNLFLAGIFSFGHARPPLSIVAFLLARLRTHKSELQN